jgi:capsular exopolysaccharide synthesis family protein
VINVSDPLWRAPGEAADLAVDLPLASVLTSDSFGSAELEFSIRPESRIALLTDPQGAGADRFRYLRLRLKELKAALGINSLILTSASPQEGKSTIAMNLATALAEGGKRKVVVVEADLRHPTVARSLGIQLRPGFAECIEKGLDPLSAVCYLKPLCWHLLQAGEVCRNPAELFQSDRLAEVIRALREQFDWLLLDSAPVAPVTDALPLARQVDRSLLVVRAGCSSRAAVDEAVSLLGRDHVAGMILNGAEELNRIYSQYYACYGSKRH